MDELTFLLILAGIGVVLLVAMFTYYKHHKKINDEIKDFNHHVDTIDDVLLDKTNNESRGDNNELFQNDLPNSFSASRQDNFDIDDVFIKHDTAEDGYFNSSPVNHSPTQPLAPQPLAPQPSSLQPSPDTAFSSGSSLSQTSQDERELVDGVYINTKRVISRSAPVAPVNSNQGSRPMDAFARSSKTSAQSEPVSPAVPPMFSELEEVTELPPSMSQHTSQHTTKTQTHENTHNQTQSYENSTASYDNPQAKHEPITTSSHNSPNAPKINIVYDPVPEGVQELIISHTILSRGKHFSGTELFSALESAGLYYGEMNIYHYPGDDEDETFALFSVANVVEPGTFNPQEPEALSTPGISMFMRLPTRMGSYEAYEEFIHVAQMVAAELDGELCDESRSQLTQQAITYKKEQIRKLNFEMAKAEKIAGISR